MRWKRIIDNSAQATFGITDINFTMASNSSESKNKDVKSLDTKAERHKENQTLS